MSREASPSQALILSSPVSPAGGCEHGRPARHCVPRCPSGRPERCPAGENPQWGTPGKRQTEHAPRSYGRCQGDSTRQKRRPRVWKERGQGHTQQAEETSSDLIHQLIGCEDPRQKGVKRAYTLFTCISCYPEEPFCGPALCWASY